ncbi:hypothetical protein [Metallosphaera sedula]|uniref:hypothetical protein n=1 Tax=Metallosphaera sedula TaxID=43687 RepID=UPI0020BEFA8B|nr:hypothetical protein [Metallosphaera sedula]BBL48370.1 hypothetical protein MJ1HA_2492 [Metallosphaera sedula]
MTLLNIPHFKDGKLTVRLLLDEELPRMGKDGYPQEGGFFLSLSDGNGKKTIFLSEAEASLLVLRLSRAIDIHTTLFRQYEAKARKERQSKKQEKRQDGRNQQDPEEIDWSQVEDQ